VDSVTKLTKRLVRVPTTGELEIAVNESGAEVQVDGSISLAKCKRLSNQCERVESRGEAGAGQ
jgi:hypothetical protein